MICSFCEAGVPAGARYCPTCGTALPIARTPGAGYEKPGAASPGGAAPVYLYQVQTSTSAVLSLVFGITAWMCLPIVGAVVAVVAGHRAKDEIRQSNHGLEGEGMATAGMILGYLQLIPALVFLVLAVIVTVLLLVFKVAAS